MSRRKAAIRGVRSVLASSELAAVENQVEALHVGGNYDDAAIVVGELLQRGIHFVLQVFSRQARVDDVVRLGNTLGAFDLDLGILPRNLDLDLPGFERTISAVRDSGPT